jgi:hypothetical protein
LEYLEGLNKGTVWKMAEGNPHQSGDIKVELPPIPILGNVPEDNSDKQGNKPIEEN